MNQEFSIRSVDDCPAWVRSHPRLQPWKQGRLIIQDRLQAWRAEYSPSVHDEALADDSVEVQTTNSRQLHCWVYHWQTAGESVDGEAVAESIEKGIGFKGDGDLGGNPVFDLALAAAMIGRHNKAAARFHDDYFRDSQQHAARVADVFAKEDAMEWWTEFIDELAGYSGQKAKLASFDGRVAVRRWLWIVRWNFLRSLLRKRNRRLAKEDELPEVVEDVRVQETTMDQQEHFLILSDIFRAAYQSLPPDDATVLAMVYSEGLSNLQTAALLGINPGNAARRRQRAERKFRTQLEQQADENKESLASLFERLQSTRTDFASQLFQIIADRTNVDDQEDMQ